MCKRVNYQSTCTIKEVSGDIFGVDDEYSIVYYVATDMKLGKGIAVKFKNKFGQIYKFKQQNVRPGDVAIVRDNSRYIYCLVAKKGTWDKPIYRDLICSLESMKNHVLAYGVTKLATQRVGTDSVWQEVKEMLYQIFQDTAVEIVVYNNVPC